MSGQTMKTKEGIDVQNGDTVWDVRAVKCRVEIKQVELWDGGKVIQTGLAYPEDGRQGSKIEDTYATQLEASFANCDRCRSEAEEAANRLAGAKKLHVELLKARFARETT